MREKIKQERRERKQQKHKAKPSGICIGMSEAGRMLARAKAAEIREMQRVHLSKIGTGWFPQVSREAYNHLKKLENASSKNYAYVVDRTRSIAGKQAVFQAEYYETPNAAGLLLSEFKIDFERNEIVKLKSYGVRNPTRF
ncbi:MAG: hypothetical protein JW744_04120 [Candidatus Diapherotrites archaeon]|uniref:Uncharacterized protein n=1 Tax=Candidatus Iainarchaeum sp. TaxID=3101447 RepID=A0A938YWW7_9ARCH|nr:hypothetical protein [Candidatus Diapherotrites archaeon]